MTCLLVLEGEGEKRGDDSDFYHREMNSDCSLLDYNIAVTGLVNFGYKSWLCFPCTGENDAIKTNIHQNCHRCLDAYSLLDFS